MLKKIFTLLIVLYPILSAYIVFGPVDLGVALCAICGVGLFSTEGFRKMKMPNGWIVFLIYIILAGFIVTHAIPARVLLYTVLLVLGCSYCDIDTLCKYYKRVAIVCIAFFLVQETARILAGINIPGIFTFLPTIYGDSSSYIANSIMDSERSSSFFLEPSYFAQFLFPLVVLELFMGNQSNKLRNAILLTVVTIFIRSGNGILLLAIVWGVWLFFSDVKKSTKRNIFIIGGIGLAAIVMYNPSILMGMMDRTSELSIHGADERWQSSGFIRFWRGYYLYDSLPVINKIFGLNPSDMDYYMKQNALGLFDGDATFINGVQTVLCLYGVVGLIFVIRHLYLCAKGFSLTSKVLMFCTMYLLLSESYFICGRMLVVIILVQILNNSNNENSIHN